jgi:DinB superfamily
MKEEAQHLRETVEKVLPFLRILKDADASLKPRPDKWSDKEILGHLIDSAANNHQRFVRVPHAPEGHLDIFGYAQETWVNTQHYNEESWALIVAMWAAYNFHLAHVIENLPADKLQNTVAIGGSGTYTLGFVASDYVEHLKHHLLQILPDVDLTSDFVNIYKL